MLDLYNQVVLVHDVFLLLMNNLMFEIEYQNSDHSNKHEEMYEMLFDVMNLIEHLQDVVVDY